MITVFKNWSQKYFSDPKAILLLCLLSASIAIVMTFGSILAPLFASIVIAYLLQGIIEQLEKLKINHLVAMLIVYLGFITLFLVLIIFLLPALWEQLINLFQELPSLMHNAQLAFSSLSVKFPDYLSDQQLHAFTQNMLEDVGAWGKSALSFSIASIPSLISWLVYLVLVPMLVFFFLKDRVLILNWLFSFLPQERKLLTQIGVEVKQQIGNYVAGKVTEMFILSVAIYIVFAFFKLKYSILLACVVGFSALVPYVGSVIVTLPVIAIGYLQFGFTAEFAYLLGIYGVIHAIDANIIVPILFSEAVNLHPVAIVIATLVFGGIWGFWGIFFAIPLATVVKAVINAWPRLQH